MDIAIYITVVSGYLVVAYLAGKNFDRFQLFKISILFAVFAVFVAIGSYPLVAGRETFFNLVQLNTILKPLSWVP